VQQPTRSRDMTKPRRRIGVVCRRRRDGLGVGAPSGFLVSAVICSGDRPWALTPWSSAGCPAALRPSAIRSAVSPVAPCLLAHATRIDISIAGIGDTAEKFGGLAHDMFFLFGSPADRVGPVALRPRLTSGLPLSTSEAAGRTTISPTVSVHITRSTRSAQAFG
jgi:hypothetical protein